MIKCEPQTLLYLTEDLIRPTTSLSATAPLCKMSKNINFATCGSRWAILVSRHLSGLELEHIICCTLLFISFPFLMSLALLFLTPLIEISLDPCIYSVWRLQDRVSKRHNFHKTKGIEAVVELGARGAWARVRLCSGLEAICFYHMHAGLGSAIWVGSTADQLAALWVVFNLCSLWKSLLISEQSQSPVKSLILLSVLPLIF